jgi:hypothetical protein
MTKRSKVWLQNWHQECFVGWLSGLIPLKEQARLVPTTSTGSAKWTNSINTLGLEGARGHDEVGWMKN